LEKESSTASMTCITARDYPKGLSKTCQYPLSEALTSSGEEEKRSIIGILEKYIKKREIEAWVSSIITLVLAYFTIQEFFVKIAALVISAVIAAYLVIRLVWDELISRKKFEEENRQLKQKIQDLQVQIEQKIQDLQVQIDRLQRVIPSILKYSRIEIKIELLDNEGTGRLNYMFSIVNETNEIIDKLRHIIETTGEPAMLESACIRGKPILSYVSMDIVQRTSMQTGKTTYEHILNFELPASDAILQKEKDVDLSYSLKLPKTYPDAFRSGKRDYHGQKVYSITDSLQFEVKAPPGYTFDSPDCSIINYVGVSDTEYRDELIREGHRPKPLSEDCIRWEIPHPRIGYHYRLYFSAKPKTT